VYVYESLALTPAIKLCYDVRASGEGAGAARLASSRLCTAALDDLLSLAEFGSVNVLQERMVRMPATTPPFRVLSLDGGGMRGTYTATYLDRVASTFAKRRGIEALDTGASFDLIVGTSTGGIIACALAAGVPLAEVVQLYTDCGSGIFSQRLPTAATVMWDLLKRPRMLSAGTKVLHDALADKFGGTTLAQIYERRGIALAITAIEMSQHHAWVFKTPHLGSTTNHRDDRYSLVDVCLATSAAPVYRSLAAVHHPDNSSDGYNVFVDGGLWANNPVLVGLIEALDLTEPEQEIEIFSLGTCPVPAGEQIAEQAVHRGLSGWRFGGEAASLSIDAQQFAFDYMAKKLARHLRRNCRIVRFPSEKVPASLTPYLGLDDTRPEAIRALVNQARTDADMTNSMCNLASADPEAAMICALFETAPTLSNPLVSRRTHVPRSSLA
jgi:hypothetical protein